jgi:hypothetical protein
MLSIVQNIAVCKTFLLLVIGLLLSFGSEGQELYKVTYGLESPLKTTSIYDIYAASDNQLYIATANGLWSFDGITFHKYKQSLDYSLEVHNIQEGQRGGIFVMDFGGNLFQLVNDSLLLKSPPIEAEIKNCFIKEDYTYYVSTKSIYAENNQTKEIIKIVLTEDVDLIQYFTDDLRFIGFSGSKQISSLFEIEKTTAKVLSDRKKLEFFYPTYKEKWCSWEQGSTCVTDSNKDTIVHFSKEIKELSPYQLLNIHGEILVACRGGLYIPAKEHVFFKGDLITKIITDVENNIWVATTSSGLHKIPSLSNLYYPTKGKFSTDIVFADTNHLICSDRTGKLYYWDDKESEFVLFYENQIKGMLKNIIFDYTTNQYCFSGNQLVFFDKDLNFKNRFGGYGELGTTPKGRLFVNQKNKIYITQLEGYYNTNVDRVKRRFSTSKQLIYEADLYTFYEQPFLKQNHLQLKTEKGVKKLTYIDNKIVFTRNDTLFGVNSNTYQLEHKITIDNLRRIWGINNLIFVVAKETVEILNSKFELVASIKRDGGIEKRIVAIQIDEKHIAIATRDAIHVYDALSYTLLHQFTIENGIISIDYDFHWLYDGNLYVNGGKGVSEIKLNDNYSRGAVDFELERILVNGAPNSSKLLHYDQNNIEFCFSVRSYTYSGRMKWRLNNKKWNTNKIGNQLVQLNELQAGAYELEAYFENDMGVESTPVYYQFNIKKPYWEMWWFYLLIGLGVLAVLGFISFQVLQTKRKEEQLMNRNNILRMQALQAQMNPHFIFNIQAAIQGLWMRGNEEAALLLQNNFSKLLRKIFQYSGQMSISIEQLLEFLENYIGLEQVRMVDGVQIDLEVDPILLEEEYFIPPLLVQPILENSFKHGLLHRKRDRQLKIYIREEAPYLYCLIEDNGVGRKCKEGQQGSNYKSSGLKTTRNRLGLLQETVIGTEHPHGNIKMTDLKDKNNQPIGTRVELWIPFVIAQDINDENN